MTSRTRSLSRTLIAVTAATAPVMALAPTATAAPSPQLPRMPQGFQPATPTLPAAPVRTLPTVEQNSVTRWVSVPVANVRSGPGTSHKVVGTKTQGAAVRGTVTSNGWLKISDTQYMAPSVVSSTDPGASVASRGTAAQSVTMYLSAGVGNVRSGPGLEHRVVGTLTQGAQVKGTWTSNGWLKVASDRYVSGTILTSTSSSGSSSQAGGGSTAPQTSQTVARWVSVPVANVRRGPSTSQPVVGTKTSGAQVRGTLSSNGWLKVSDTQYLAPSVLTSTQPADSTASNTTSNSTTKVTQYVTATVGNVRSGSGLNHAVVGTVRFGTKVTGTWTSNNWLDLGNGRFVSGLILSSTNPATPAPPAAQLVDRWVSAAVANVRSGPATTYAVVGTRVQGTKVTGELTSNGWLKLSPTEYMAPSVLSTTPPASGPGTSPAPVPPAPTPLRQALLNTAAQYVGHPYVLYGTPPQAFDCSSYTWWVFRQHGINIPKTVRDQRTVVTPVTNPQPGDLVFYKKWYHVAIYAGNGMVYDARNPSTGVMYGPMLQDPDMWFGRVPGV